MKMELTRHGIITIITLSEYILYPTATHLFCGSVEAIPWTERLRQKYHNSVYWRKKFCQGGRANVKCAHDDLKDTLQRTLMVKNGSDYISYTYTVYNSRMIELLKTMIRVDDERVIFQNKGIERIATIIRDNENNARPGALLKTMSPVTSYCVIDDQPDYRILMNYYRDYAMVEIIDDLMQRYVNTSANPLQKYENNIANVLAQQSFEGTCTNVVPNKFPFEFSMGERDHFVN